MAVLELVQFKLKADVSDADFLTAAAETQTGFLAQNEGFIRREIWKNADNQWIDMIYWTSLEAAHASMQQFITHPATQPFMTAIDPDSTTASHYLQVKAF